MQQQEAETIAQLMAQIKDLQAQVDKLTATENAKKDAVNNAPSTSSLPTHRVPKLKNQRKAEGAPGPLTALRPIGSSKQSTAFASLSYSKVVGKSNARGGPC